MKKTLSIFLLFMLLGSVSLFAQEQTEKLTRDQKKELRQQQKEEQIELIKTALNDTAYVLEADYLSNKSGQRVSVSSSINFISVNKNRAVFQFGSAYTAGYNGVGGATFEGRITSYEITPRKNGQSYYIRLNISTTRGFFGITLDVGSTGMSSATVSTNSRHKLMYSGKLVPLNSSKVFKGMSF